jgi:hypothetical protein
MRKRNIRKYMALAGSAAAVVALITATVALAQPTDPCYVSPPPPSCLGYPADAHTTATATGIPTTAAINTTVITQTIGGTPTTMTATVMATTTTIRGTPTTVQPTAAVLTTKVNGTPSVMTFPLPTPTTPSSIPAVPPRPLR